MKKTSVPSLALLGQMSAAQSTQAADMTPLPATRRVSLAKADNKSNDIQHNGKHAKPLVEWSRRLSFSRSRIITGSRFRFGRHAARLPDTVVSLDFSPCSTKFLLCTNDGKTLLGQSRTGVATPLLLDQFALIAHFTQSVFRVLCAVRADDKTALVQLMDISGSEQGPPLPTSPHPLKK